MPLLVGILRFMYLGGEGCQIRSLTEDCAGVGRARVSSLLNQIIEMGSVANTRTIQQS